MLMNKIRKTVLAGSIKTLLLAEGAASQALLAAARSVIRSLHDPGC